MTKQDKAKPAKKAKIDPKVVRGAVIISELHDSIKQKQKEGMKIKHITMSEEAHSCIKAMLKDGSDQGEEGAKLAYDDLSQGNFLQIPCTIDKDLDEDTFIIKVSECKKPNENVTVSDLVQVLKLERFWLILNSILLVINITSATLHFTKSEYWWILLDLALSALFIYLLIKNIKKMAKYEVAITNKTNI